MLDILSQIELPNVELGFADPNYDEKANVVDDNVIITGQIKRLELRLKRAKTAYMDGADTLEEYKETKNTIENEIEELKAMIETVKEE